MGEDVSQRAVSLYGQTDAMDDFPVLKAFQQYVDAEQEKSRKRILLLGIIFGAILIGVVAVFLFMLQNINMRNQALSDRLVEYAMKEADKHAEGTAPVAQPQNDAVIKMMGETLKTLQAQVVESNKRAAEAVANKTKEPEPDPVYDRKMQKQQDLLRREKEELEAEKQRLAAEKERLRQIEIDRQRRKLYPELYGEARSENMRQTGASPYRSRTLSDADIQEILAEVDKARKSEDAIEDASDEEDSEKVRPKKAKKDARKAQKKHVAVEETKATDDEDDEEEDSDAIEYFKDEEFKMPVDYKGNSLKMSLPVE